MNLRKAATTAAILVGFAASGCTTAAADQFGNGNVEQHGGGTARDNGSNSTTRIAINGHVLLMTNDNGTQHVFIDDREVFGQEAEHAIHAARSGQQWW